MAFVPSIDDLESLHQACAQRAGEPEFLALGEAYWQLEDAANVLKTARTGLTRLPGSTALHRMAAMAAGAMHDWHGARDHLVEVAKSGSIDGAALALFGEALLRLGDGRAVAVLAHAQAAGADVRTLQAAATGGPLPAPRDRPAPRAPRPAARVAQMRRESHISEIQLPPPVQSEVARPSAAANAVPATGAYRPSATDVRPRVVAGSKKTNAAADALRRSASAGDHHLRSLLASGLLDVGGIRVPDGVAVIRAPKVWRGGARWLVFFATLTLLASSAAAAWRWYSHKQDTNELNALATRSGQILRHGTPAELAEVKAMVQAAQAKGRVPEAMRVVEARAEALRGLLYGGAAKVASNDGIALAAMRLATCEDPAGVEQAVVGTDSWHVWLRARAQLCAGHVAEAAVALEALAPTFTLARIDWAEVLAERGDSAGAIAAYNDALATSRDHPLALVGRALTQAEANVDVEAALDDLAVRVDETVGPRIAERKKLALAWARYGLEDLSGAHEVLAKTQDLSPRDRVLGGILALLLGDRSVATNALRVSASSPRTEILAALLAVRDGKPAAALRLVEKSQHGRANLVRAQAYIDLADNERAVEAAAAALKLAPTSWEAQLFAAWAAVMPGGSRKLDLAPLEKVARRQKSRLGRHALGVGLRSQGDTDAAAKRLQQAVTDMSLDEPHPAPERSYFALAELASDAGRTAALAENLQAALAANPEFAPALALARRARFQSDPDGSLGVITKLRTDGATWPSVDLLWVEAVLANGAPTAAQRTQINPILRAALDRGGDRERLAQLAKSTDPALLEELGLASEKPPAPRKRTTKRRRR